MSTTQVSARSVVEGEAAADRAGFTRVELMRAEWYRRAHKQPPTHPPVDVVGDPVFVEALWDGSAEMVAVRFGVTARTVSRWRNGHMRPGFGQDRSAVSRKGWETRRSNASVVI